MRPPARHHRPSIWSTAIFRSLPVPKQIRPPAWYQSSILRYSFLLFANAKANAAAGRASSTFHLAAQSSLRKCQSLCDRWQSIINFPFYHTIFCSSPMPKRMRPLAEHHQPSILPPIFCSSPLPKRMRPPAELHRHYQRRTAITTSHRTAFVQPIQASSTTTVHQLHQPHTSTQNCQRLG
jgi:hypothetical protein